MVAAGVRVLHGETVVSQGVGEVVLASGTVWALLALFSAEASLPLPTS
jgi:hypothetical protein